MEPNEEFSEALAEMIKKAIQAYGDTEAYTHTFTNNPPHNVLEGVTFHVNCKCNLCDAVEQSNKFKAAMNQILHMAGSSVSELEAISQGLLNLAKPTKTLEEQLQDALARSEYEIALKALQGWNARMN